MFGSIILSVFVLIIFLFVYTEYKNEKKYQEERRQKREGNRKKETKSVSEPSKVPSAKELEAKREQEKKLEEKQLEEKRLEEKKPEEKTPEPKTIAITLADYPKFDHSRLLDMGLSQEEAIEFVKELIPQIAAQIPLLREALEKSDFHTMERLTHSIKGSATTVGAGGISDLLIDYNTYLKTGAEVAIAKAYFEQLNHYYVELKKQYLE